MKITAETGIIVIPADDIPDMDSHEYMYKTMFYYEETNLDIAFSRCFCEKDNKRYYNLGLMRKLNTPQGVTTEEIPITEAKYVATLFFGDNLNLAEVRQKKKVEGEVFSYDAWDIFVYCDEDWNPAFGR